jgi:hypothetical protein
MPDIITHARLTGRALEDEFCAIATELGGDAHARAEADAYLAHTHALYHGGAAPWAMNPKIFDNAGIATLRDAAETMGRIMDKVTARYLVDPSLRARFALPAPLERYALVPTGYDRLVPIARLDVFFNEETGDYQFCETNTDGSAGMVNSLEATRAIQQTPTYAEFARRHPSVSTFNVPRACVEALINVYTSWENASKGRRRLMSPSIAIVDYEESILSDEAACFLDVFHDAGIFARFSDVRSLRLADAGGMRSLVDDEGPIDLVWRRAVPSDVVEKPCDGVEAMVRAQAAGLACVIGGFRTWPVATKTFFSLLWSDVAAQLLSADEVDFVRSHVPHTVTLDASSDLSAYRDRERWIVKPAGGYNGTGVVAGLDVDAEAWEGALARTQATGGVVQAYAPQYATPTIYGGEVPGWADPTNFPLANNMEGLYLFDGAFGGVFPRCSRKATIGMDADRLSMGCLLVDE